MHSAAMIRSAVMLTLAIAISGCAATSFPDGGGRERTAGGRESAGSSESVDRASRGAGERVAEEALAMLGKPYRYGGASPLTGFDCSGLVWYSFLQTGISVPRTSTDQYRAARKIALADALEGDILFFEDEDKLSHIGIYVGGGRFVHAPATGRTVSIADLDNAYYQRHLIGVGRLLR